MRSLDPRPSRGTVARRRARVAGGVLLALWLGHVAAQPLQIIELRHRRADDVIPALQPLVEPGGILTGLDATLFVRTSATNFAQIQAAVAVLDRQPRQLLITVGQGTVATDAQALARGSATIGGGDVQVGVNRPPLGDPGVTAQVFQERQTTDLHHVSSIRTLEGTETFIAVGQSAPLTTTQPLPGRGRPGAVQTTEYRSVSTGFYATVRLDGDRVILQVAPQQQRFSGPAAARTVQSAGVNTQVSGRLGEWLPLGGSTDSRRRDGDGLLTHDASERSARYAAWVKVEEVP